MKKRFGRFEFDAVTRELRRDGEIVKLQSQPAQVLAVLIEHAGEVVTRDALRQAVWGEDTFVDFDKGLNFAIAQVRTALGDSADAPTYIRTFPKRGYQFIGNAAPSVEVRRPVSASPGRRDCGRDPGDRGPLGRRDVEPRRHATSTPARTIAVARFDNHKPDSPTTTATRRTSPTRSSGS